ncbi:MAG TPA: enoyl-CoA hydratase/isomerase family protein [Burkholderiaceae bacterium]|nr:enoyl-CoA hydratase/isomerase family protein [Burkholderiaceae bacterium]
MDRYANYRSLRLTRHDDGVLEIAMTCKPGQKLPTADDRTHFEMAEIWRDFDADPQAKVAVIRGEGAGFSAGGDTALVETMADDFHVRARVWREARDLVHNMINCGKPIVSAIHGPAAGAGLVCGLMADISIATRGAKLVDAHTRLGVAAGDHAAIIWPLLCGMAKSKYYLLLCDPVSGEEAERIGLVSLVVDSDAELLPRAFEVARRLAGGSQTAIKWTKYALNNWLRMAGPIFDTSLAVEMMGFGGPDVKEGVRALREKRAPRFEDDSPF